MAPSTATDESQAKERRITRPPRHRLIPTNVAALAAGVTEATIRKWVSRGKLTRYGTPGRAEFDIEELTEIALRRQ